MEFVELGKVCGVIAGQSPPSSTYNQDKKGLPFFQGKADFGRIYPTVRYWCTEPKKISIPNDILFSVRAPVGSTNINNIEASIGRGLSAIRCGEKVELKFLLHYLRGNEEKIANLGTGSTFKAITIKTLKELKIPLPPLPEQQRIARLLDEADKLRQFNQQLIQKYEQLTQSLFLEMFGDPVTNPKGWEKVKLGSLGIWKSGGTPSRKNNLYFQGNIPWVSSGELNNIFIDNSIEKITNLAIEESNTKIIEKGSILLGMYDTAALKSSINTVEICCNQAIAYSKVKKEVVNTIFLYFNIQIAKEYLKRIQRGVRQKNLNLSMIKNIKITLPPLDLQTQFAERVGLIEVQKQQAQEALQKSEDLFNSLLQQVFKA